MIAAKTQEFLAACHSSHQHLGPSYAGDHHASSTYRSSSQSPRSHNFSRVTVRATRHGRHGPRVPRQPTHTAALAGSPRYLPPPVPRGSCRGSPHPFVRLPRCLPPARRRAELAPVGSPRYLPPPLPRRGRSSPSSSSSLSSDSTTSVGFGFGFGFGSGWGWGWG